MSAPDRCDISANIIPGNVTYVRDVVDAFASIRLFHGGVAGLNPGDRLLPGHQHLKLYDDCATCQAHARGEHGPLEPDTPPDRVYATEDRQYARFYASKVGLGWLYRVRPVAELHPSTEDDPNLPTYWTTELEVVAVLERAVRLTWRERRRLFIRMGGTEAEWRLLLAGVKA